MLYIIQHQCLFVSNKNSLFFSPQLKNIHVPDCLIFEYWLCKTAPSKKTQYIAYYNIVKEECESNSSVFSAEEGVVMYVVNDILAF